MYYAIIFFENQSVKMLVFSRFSSFLCRNRSKNPQNETPVLRLLSVPVFYHFAPVAQRHIHLLKLQILPFLNRHALFKSLP